LNDPRRFPPPWSIAQNSKAVDEGKSRRLCLVTHGRCVAGAILETHSVGLVEPAGEFAEWFTLASQWGVPVRAAFRVEHGNQKPEQIMECRALT